MNVKPSNVLHFKSGKPGDSTQETEDHLAAVVARLNSEHAIVTVGGRTSVMTERPSEEHLGRIDRTFSRRQDLELYYSNDLHVVGVNEKGKQIIKTAVRNAARIISSRL